MLLILSMLGIMGLSHAGIAEEISAESAAFHQQFAQTDAKNVLPADLKKWLNSSDSKIRLQALYYMDQKHPDALQACQNLKNDPNEEIRKICKEVLILHLGQSAIPELMNQLPQESPANQRFILDYLIQNKQDMRSNPEILKLLLRTLQSNFQHREKWLQDEETLSEDISELSETYFHLILAYPKEKTLPILQTEYKTAQPAYAFFILELFQKMDFNLFLNLLSEQLTKSPKSQEWGNALANFRIDWTKNYPEVHLETLVKLYFEQGFQISNWIIALLKEKHPGNERIKTELYPQLKTTLQPYLMQSKHQARLWDLIFMLGDPLFLPELVSSQLKHPKSYIRDQAFNLLRQGKSAEIEAQMKQLLNSPHLDMQQSALLWFINQKPNTPEIKEVGIKILKFHPNEVYGYILEYMWKTHFDETEKTIYTHVVEKNEQALYHYWQFVNQTQNAEMFAKLKPLLFKINPNLRSLNLLLATPFESQSVSEYFWQQALESNNQEMLLGLLFYWKDKKIPLPTAWVTSLSCTEDTVNLIQSVIENPNIYRSDHLFQSCIQLAQTEISLGQNISAFYLLMNWPQLSELDKLKLLKQMPQPPVNAKAVSEAILRWRMKLKDANLKDEIKQRILAGTASTEELEFCADDVLLMDEAFFSKLKQNQLNTSFFNANKMAVRDTALNRERLLTYLPKMSETDLISLVWLLEKWGDVRMIPILSARFQTGSRQLKATLLVLRAKLGDRLVLPDVLKAIQSTDLLFRSAGLDAMVYMALTEQDLKPIATTLKQMEFDSLEKRDLSFYSAPTLLKLEESLKQFKLSKDTYKYRDWKDLILSQNTGPDDSRVVRGLISRENPNEQDFVFSHGKVGAYVDFRLSFDQPLIKAALMRGPQGILADLKQKDPLIRLQAAVLCMHLPAPQQLPLLNKLSQQNDGQLKALVNLARYIQGDFSVKDFLHRYLVQNSNGYWGGLLVAHAPREGRLKLAQALIAEITSKSAQMQIISETSLSEKEEKFLMSRFEKEEEISSEQMESLLLLKNELKDTSQALKNLVGDEKEFKSLPQTTHELNQWVWQLFFESESQLRESIYDLDITTISRQERLTKRLKELKYDPRQAEFETKLKGQSLHITAIFRKHQFKLIENIFGKKTALDWLKKRPHSELFVIPAYQYWVQAQLIQDPNLKEIHSLLAGIQATINRFGYQDNNNYPFARISLAHMKAAIYYHQKKISQVEQALAEMKEEFNRLPSKIRFGMNYGIWQAIYHKWQGLFAEQKENFTLAEEEWLWSLWWVGYVYHDSSNYSWESWDPLFQPQHTRHLLRSHKKIPSQNRQWYERYFGRDFSQVDDALKPLLLTDK